MHGKTEYKFNSFDTFVLRTPRLSLEYLLKVINSEDEILNFFKKNTFIQEAIYYASPQLYKAVNNLLLENVKNIKRKNKIIFSLFKYFIRMSTKCTPYGLFSGYSTGKIRENNSIVKITPNYYKNYLELDFCTASIIVNYIIKLDIVKNQIKYYSNNSYYQIGDLKRYIKFIRSNNSTSLELNKINNNKIITKIIRQAAKGITKSELQLLLKKNLKTDIDCTHLLNDFIDSQILISQIDFFTSSLDPINFILDIITNLNEKNPEIILVENTLMSIKLILQNINNNKKKYSIQIHKTILKLLNSLPLSFEENNLLNVTLINYSNKPSISTQITKEISEFLEILPFMFNNSEQTNIKTFKDKYYKYYKNAEIPLTLALDPELGIGYPPDQSNLNLEPFMQNIIAANRIQPNSTNRNINIDSFYLNTYFKAVKFNNYEIQLDIDELKKTKLTDLHDEKTISVLESIINKSDVSNDYQIKINAIINHASKVIARFSNKDKRLLDLANEISNYKTSNDSNLIYAEIVHSPEFKACNISQRHSFLKYEIPYHGSSNVSDKFQIHVKDILISIKNEKIVLRSKSLNKEILPVLSSAHNYENSKLPIYKFLCDIQNQNFPPYFHFTWGALENVCTFLPRVLYKNIIVSSARWKIDKSEFIPAFRKDEIKRDLILNTIINKYKIPRFISLVNTHGELMIDLNNRLSKYLLIDEIIKLKSSKSITLVEFIIEDKNHKVKSNSGGFVNEFVFSYFSKNNYNSTQYNSTPKFKSKPENINVSKLFLPGDEWIYYKIYCSPKSADFVLLYLIKHIVEYLENNKIIQKWFFIRYSDPEFHLRLRLHLTNINLLNEAFRYINSFLKTFLNKHIISHFHIDVYEREIDRYGKNTITMAESLFHIDSKAVIQIIESLNSNNELHKKLILGLKSIDNILNDFNFTLNEKLNFTENYLNLKQDPINKSKNINYILDQQFRAYKNDLHNILSTKIYFSNDWLMYFSVLSYRSFEIKNLYFENKVKFSKNKLIESIYSFVHMNINRLFSFNSNSYEDTIYYLLNKYYISLSIQLNKETNNKLK